MKILSSSEAAQLLNPLNIRIGDWNNLCPLNSDGKALIYEKYSPSSDAVELYVIAYRLSNWIVSGDWTLLQIDNSTVPMKDEIAIFDKFVLEGASWDIDRQRTFLFHKNERQATVALLIYFSLLFSWHVHLISELSTSGKRLSLQDKVIYFLGATADVEDAKMLIEKITKNPKALDS